MFPAFDYNHEKDEYRNGYDNGQGDKGFLLWGTDFDDKNNI